jgi:hypothetical protein
VVMASSTLFQFIHTENHSSIAASRVKSIAGKRPHKRISLRRDYCPEDRRDRNNAT